MSLTTCLDEIKKTKPVANEDVEAGNYQTLNARRGRKAAAIERLKELRYNYRYELGKTAMFLVVTGSQAQELADALVPFSGFVRNPEDFYNDLAHRMCPVIAATKGSISNLFDVLGRHLEDKMRELGVTEYNQIIMKASYGRTVSNETEFAALVKQAINEQVGPEVAGLQAIVSSVDEAIEREHSGSASLFVLPTQDEDFVKTLSTGLKRLSPNVFVVTAGKTSKTMRDLAGSLTVKAVNEDSVDGLIKAIKSQRK
jgi:hypothetical protein